MSNSTINTFVIVSFPVDLADGAMCCSVSENLQELWTNVSLLLHLWRLTHRAFNQQVLKNDDVINLDSFAVTVLSEPCLTKG